jgi:hypothetical protein
MYQTLVPTDLPSFYSFFYQQRTVKSAIYTHPGQPTKTILSSLFLNVKHWMPYSHRMRMGGIRTFLAACLGLVLGIGTIIYACVLCPSVEHSWTSSTLDHFLRIAEGHTISHYTHTWAGLPQARTGLELYRRICWSWNEVINLVRRHSLFYYEIVYNCLGLI